MNNQSTTSELLNRHCKSKVTTAAPAELARWTPMIPQWKVEPSKISREFKFENYYQTISFVNAIAWIANREDHHPDLAVGYNRCVVEFSTHSVGGLSENDFICAARADRMHENP